MVGFVTYDPTRARDRPGEVPGLRDAGNTAGYGTVTVWSARNARRQSDIADRLHLSDIAGTLVQELLVRPDLSAMQVWFELRGDPTVGDRVTLSAGQNNTYTWAFSRAGLSMSGWLRRTGQPVGTTLEVHIDSATYGSWSRSNFTLPPLARLP